jgi:hypothetical protein
MGRIPTGVGVFARDQSAAWLSQWDFVAVNGSRNDASAKVAALRSRGVDVWLYSGPDAWRPDQWRAELTRIASLASATGALGIIADPETSWPQLSPTRRQSEGAALGTALASLSRAMSVGLTSYPLFPALDPMVGAILANNGDVWGCPQLYAKGRPPSAIAQWYGLWLSKFAAVIPAVSGWVSDPSIADVDGFIAYLNSVPASPAGIAWPTAGNEGRPAWLWSVLRQWEPQGSLLDRGRLIIGGDLANVGYSTRAGYGVVAGLLVALGLVAFLVWKAVS